MHLKCLRNGGNFVSASTCYTQQLKVKVCEMVTSSPQDNEQPCHVIDWWVLIFREEGFQLPAQSQHSEMMENANTMYCETSCIRRTKSQNLYVSLIVLQLSLPHTLKPGIF